MRWLAWATLLNVEREGLPAPTRQRLAQLLHLLNTEGWAEGRNFSSRVLARWLNVTAETMRRDLSWLGGGHAGSVWKAEELRSKLERVLGFSRTIRTALVGLDDWALDLFVKAKHQLWGMKLVAGFESRLNKLESLDLPLPLFPTVEIPQRVEQLEIEAAILAVQNPQALRLAERLAQSKIKGILNLSGYPLKSSPHLRVVDASVQKLWNQLFLGLVSE